LYILNRSKTHPKHKTKNNKQKFKFRKILRRLIQILWTCLWYYSQIM